MENAYEGFHNFTVLLLPFGMNVSQQKQKKTKNRVNKYMKEP